MLIFYFLKKETAKAEMKFPGTELKIATTRRRKRASSSSFKSIRVIQSLIQDSGKKIQLVNVS